MAFNALSFSSTTASESVEESLREFEENFKSLTESYSLIGYETEAAMEVLRRHLESSVESAEGWAESIVDLSQRGISEGLLAELEKAGPEAAEMINSLVDASDEELGRLSDIFENISQDATSGLMSALTEAGPDSANLVKRLVNANDEELRRMITVFENHSKGAADSLLAELEKSVPEAAELSGNIVDASGSEIERFPKVMESGIKAAADVVISELNVPAVTNSGSDMVDNIAEGVASNPNLENESERLIRRTLNTVNTEINSGGFTRAGSQIVTNMVRGVRDRSEDLVEAGLGMTENIAQGIRDGTDPLVRVVEDMVRRMIEAIWAQMASVTAMAPMSAAAFSAGYLRSRTDAVEETASLMQESLNRAFSPAELGLHRYIRDHRDEFELFTRSVRYAFHNAPCPAVSVYSGSPSECTNTTNNNFYQTNNITSNELSDAQKIRQLEFMSRRMMRRGV